MPTWSYYPNNPLPQGLNSFWSTITLDIGMETVRTRPAVGWVHRVRRLASWVSLFSLVLALGVAVHPLCLFAAGTLPVLFAVGALGWLVIAICAALWRRCRWGSVQEVLWGSAATSAEQEALVAEMVGAEVLVDRRPGAECLGRYQPMVRHAKHWAGRVRERFGVVQNKAADLMAVRRWIADEMAKEERWRDLRVTDRVAMQALVTKMVTLPTVWELEVDQMMRGTLAQELMKRHQAAPR